MIKRCRLLMVLFALCFMQDLVNSERVTAKKKKGQFNLNFITICTQKIITNHSLHIPIN